MRAAYASEARSRSGHRGGEHLAERRRRQGLVLQRLPTSGDDRIDVEPGELLRERRAAPRPFAVPREDRHEGDAVRRRDEMEGAADGAHPHGLAALDEPAQLQRIEGLDARPERDIRVDRLLRLEADEPLDDLARRSALAGQQALPRQQRPVEGALVQHRTGRGHPVSRPRRGPPGTGG